MRPEYVEKYGADGVRGLLYGDGSQFVMQLLNISVCLIFGAVMAFVWFKVSDLIMPMRVSPETELEGLDGPEMGAIAYPDFAVHVGGKRLAG